MLVPLLVFCGLAATATPRFVHARDEAGARSLLAERKP
jgi:hypothetical protein